MGRINVSSMASQMNNRKLKLIIVVSEDWSFWSHRLPLAMFAIKAGFEVIVVTKLNKYEKRIREMGINVININFRRSLNTPFIDLCNLIKLINLFRKEKPDIIHNVALKTILIGSIAGLFTKNSIVVNAYTGLGYVFSSNQLKAIIIQIIIKPFLKLIIRKKNYWAIFQNPDDMHLFTELGLNVTKRSVLIRGSGIDINKFSKVIDKNKKPRVMLASRMLWDKGVGEFVKAAKFAREKNIEAEFIIVGDVDEDNPMSIPVPVLKKWTNSSYVDWKGYSDNMFETLSSASIICLPSYREGLPMVLLEAAAIGRPLIATDVPGCREIVKDGYNGILVKPKDVNSLYNAIFTLIHSSEIRKVMGENGRKLVENEFSTEIVNSKIISLYKKARNIKY
mgnify:CR=1 FL=1